MSFESTRSSWEYLAQRDPLWAILSTPEARGRKWDTTLFFATGQEQIERAFAWLTRENFLPRRFDTALDFGCGVGRLSRALAGRFGKVIAIDISPTMLTLGRELNPGYPQIEFTLNQTPDLRIIDSGSISFVYSYVVLQHIPSREAEIYIGEMMRVLEPGGVAMFQVPTRDRSSLPRRLVRGVLRTIVQKLGLRIDAFHIEMHVVPFASIEAVARKQGCEFLARFDGSESGMGDGGTPQPAEEPQRLTSETFVYRRPDRGAAPISSE